MPTKLVKILSLLSYRVLLKIVNHLSNQNFVNGIFDKNYNCEIHARLFSMKTVSQTRYHRIEIMNFLCKMEWIKQENKIPKDMDKKYAKTEPGWITDPRGKWNIINGKKECR